jgi:hypothetical protein
MTTRVKIRRKNNKIVQDCDVYIGRACNMGGWNLLKSKFANPYVIGKNGDREECVNKYEKYMRNNDELMESLLELEGKILGCWCNEDQLCHGDVLIKLINELN